MVGKAKKNLLGREAWITAAFGALVEGGVEAVRVEPLAQALGVTKGSFYWHFADRAGLLEAVLGYWEQIATSNVIAEVEAHGGDAKAQLWKLIEICVAGKADRVEGAIRAWGAGDVDAAQALASVDQRREQFVIDLFREHGLSKAESAHRARILYLALIGSFTWNAHGGAPSSKSTWKALHALLIS